MSSEDVRWEKRLAEYLDDKVAQLREQNELKLEIWKREIDAAMKVRIRELRQEVFVECIRIVEQQAACTIPEVAGGLLIAANTIRTYAAVDAERTT